MDTEYGTRAEEFTRAIESGPPYVVRYSWAGGKSLHERNVVTEAIAACFGVKTLEREQTIDDPKGESVLLADRVRYAFWLLRTLDLSLGFTHGWENVRVGSPSDPADARHSGKIYKISLRVDRSRRHEY